MTKASYAWIEDILPVDLRIAQVYVFVFNSAGRILVQRDHGHYNLPGGKPEEFDSDIFETARREALEESTIIVSNMSYLGYVDVHESVNHYAQVRLIGELEEAFERLPDPATGRIYDRLYFDEKQAIDSLKWGRHGELQIKSAFTDWNQ